MLQLLFVYNFGLMSPVAFFIVKLLLSVEMASDSSKRTRKNVVGNRLDPCWDHGIEVDSTAKKVKCKHCSKVYSGEIFRLKHHLGGTHSNVEPCLQVPNGV